MDIENFRFKKVPKEIWHDCNKECLVHSPRELDDKVLTNSRKKHGDEQAWNRIQGNFGNMLKDNDKDGVINAFDKQPNKKNKKRFNIKRFI